MIKKIFLMSLSICMLYLLGTVSFAAPSQLSSTYISSIDVIDVTNPEDGVTTFKDNSVVSLIGQENVAISLYLYDPNLAKFVLFHEANGESSWIVGPSGLFIKRIPIDNGVNYIGVFAEYDGNGQFITRRVDRAKLSVKNQIKTIFFKSMNDIVKTSGQNNN